MNPDTDQAWGVFFHTHPNAPHRVFDTEAKAQAWVGTDLELHFIRPVHKVYFHGPTITIFVWQPIPEEDQ